ncbi:MAG: hypothetical protein QXN56_03285, partial [Candidatus Hadarchaeum sp.]
YGNEWKSAVLDVFMAPPETPGVSEAPEEKTGGSTIWQALQAIAALVLALMAMAFVAMNIWRGSAPDVEPTTATVAQDVAPTVQALGGRLDALAVRVEDLGKQLEKALGTPTPVPPPTPTPTPSPVPPTPIPSPPPVISLRGRVEPADLAQKMALLVKSSQDGATDGEAVTPTATGAFTLTLPADWEGDLQVEWTSQEVVVKGVAPEDAWIPTKNPWTGFVTGTQSRNPISQGVPLPDLVIALESVPQAEKFLSELNGTFSEAPAAQRRTFPGREGTSRGGKIPPIKILGQAQVREKEEWGLACCESTQSFFWASFTAQIISLEDKTQASKLPILFLPDGIVSLNNPPNGWQFREVDGISVLFNQSDNAQELVWSLDSPSGWFKLQAWAAAGSTATASYEVLVGPNQVSLPPVTGTTVVSPLSAGAMSSFADIGVYHLAQSQPITVRLKAPAEGQVGVGLIRVLRLQE